MFGRAERLAREATIDDATLAGGGIGVCTNSMADTPEA
jgi:hypothetical protein